MRFGNTPFCVPIAGRSFRVLRCAGKFRGRDGVLRVTHIDLKNQIIWVSTSVAGDLLAAELALAVAATWGHLANVGGE
ncbi:MAG: hypothetical protein ACM359_12170 [Bacillota bacterium]